MYLPGSAINTINTYDPGEGLAQQTQNICITFVQRLRRWSNIVQMLYKCFVFSGLFTHACTVYTAVGSCHLCFLYVMCMSGVHIVHLVCDGDFIVKIVQ